MLFSTSCGISEEQQIANYTATIGGLCLRQYGRSGREPLEFDRLNIINKPSSFNEREYPKRTYIYSTILILSYWYEYSLEIHPTISWEFSDPSYFRVEETDTTDDPHVIVQIIKWPASSSSADAVDLTLTGTVAYKGASATMTYDIGLRYTAEQEAYDQEDSAKEEETNQEVW